MKKIPQRTCIGCKEKKDKKDLIRIVKDKDGNSLIRKDGAELSKFQESDIKNRYVAKVKPGKHSLIIPLGSKAEISIADDVFNTLPKGEYSLILTDISGITWTQTILN